MFTVDQVKEMFSWAEKNPGRWVAVVQSVIVDLVDAHQTTRKGATLLAKEGREFRQFFDALKRRAAGEAEAPEEGEGGEEVAGAPPRGGVRVPVAGAPSASGSGPLDAAQAEAERMMDEAAGPRPSEAPQQAPPQRVNGGARRVVRRPGPPPAAPPAGGGGNRKGNDGTPVDDAQEAAERAMDEAAGPRE